MKHFKKLIIFLLIVLAGTIVFTYKPPVEIMGDASEALKLYYDVKKADEVNSRQILVVRDGEKLDLTAKQSLFMTQAMVLVSPVNTAR